MPSRSSAPEPDADAAYARALTLALCPRCDGNGADAHGGDCPVCETSGLVDQAGDAFHPPAPFDTWAPSQLVALWKASSEREGKP